jgi:hypothetical protein
MRDLGFDLETALGWFPPERDHPYILVRVRDTDAKGWTETLAVAVRRCYVSDELVTKRAGVLSVPEAQIVEASLPPPGAVMAGDFGEILAYFYIATRLHPQAAVGPKKWRLKQDRTKPAPYSDVLSFVLPSWPAASEEDRLICSEVKTKSTPGDSNPIGEAIEGTGRDRTSRLARTLVWLRDRGLREDLGAVTLQHLNRFIDATEHPSYARDFIAVAVLSTSLLDEEVVHAPSTTPEGYSVVILAVPELREVYASVFEAAAKAAIEDQPVKGREV